jgi:hypothetical protein
MVLNGPEAIGAAKNSVEVFDRTGILLASLAGSKQEVAAHLFSVIEKQLIDPQTCDRAE